MEGFLAVGKQFIIFREIKHTMTQQIYSSAQEANTTECHKCCRCGISKLAAEFYRRKSRKIGIDSMCKMCRNARVTARRKANSEEYNEYMTKWRHGHPESIRLHKRRQYLKNPGVKITSNHFYRARALAAIGAFSEREWQVRLAEFGYKCACCGSVENLQRDHIVPLIFGGSNDIENIQPLCSICNASKGSAISCRVHI